MTKKSEQTVAAIKPNRPQTPKAPFPYNEEEVNYKNAEDNITLSGTLTVPRSFKKLFPAVLLISGMGANNRDYEMLGHALFLVLADHLTRQGIAVLRVDKRGVGKSTGTYDFNVTSKDLSRDAIAGIQYLKTRPDIDHKKIGLIGHSEGGMIATIVAKESQDVAFIGLMAGAIVTDINTNIKQVAMQLKADGASKAMRTADQNVRRKLLTIVKKESDPSVAKIQLQKVIEKYLHELSDTCKVESKKLHFAINEINTTGIIEMFNSPWYRYFLTYNPLDTLKHITIPVLAINGSRDFITSSQIALPLIKEALQEAKNDNYEIIELPNQNHWFQTCETGSLMEYGTIEETLSPSALNAMSEWILKQTEKEAIMLKDCLMRKRLKHEQPSAISERGWRYHHIGIPYAEPRPGEQHYKHLKVYVSGFDTSPYGIEWIRFEKDCQVPDVVRNVPHVAFEVDDLDQALKGKEILLEPGAPSGGVRAAMIIHNGAPVELIEFSNVMEPNKTSFDSRLASQEYDKAFLELTEMLYGPGFLSQGGPKEIDEMFCGIDLNGLKILDIGSGLGGPAFYLAKNNAVEIIGIDPQVSITEKAQKNLDSQLKELKGKVSFVLMTDPANLKQFTDNSFDIVFAIESIMHVPSEIKIDYFKEVYRVLKASGEIIILDWMHSPTYKYDLPFHLLTTKGFHKMLEDAGFENIQFTDTTLHRVAVAQQNIDTITLKEDVIKQRFDKEIYQHALMGWTFMRDNFKNGNLRVGFFRATK